VNNKTGLNAQPVMGKITKNLMILIFKIIKFWLILPVTARSL